MVLITYGNSIKKPAEVPLKTLRHFLDTNLAMTEQNRSINRHEWDYDELKQKLADPESQHSKVAGLLKELVHLRQHQRAFHPNATQFTLHFEEQLFGCWRQSVDRRQSIFCIYNITDNEQPLQVADLNPIMTDRWWDLISGHIFDESTETIMLEPYQVL